MELCSIQNYIYYRLQVYYKLMQLVIESTHGRIYFKLILSQVESTASCFYCQLHTFSLYQAKVQQSDRFSTLPDERSSVLAACRARAILRAGKAGNKLGAGSWKQAGSWLKIVNRSENYNLVKCNWVKNILKKISA